ncbi:hypothetical protein Y032_0702g1658 [Ancylostoma ceylanicum]|uniref:G-protein coupled receptors family 1 profile domain-containing protein n=1 Tax=Ancylostoma ceylanicum TaxID=53326 RepID=A0A016WGB9_9BILA|nr:hypothetical protein Y032_0702g1658 [Ancylostoma ceylanicum]
MECLIKNGWNAEKIPDYGCENTPKEGGQTNFVVGICFIIYGVITEFLYMVDVMVMMKKQQRRLSCYKIMIALGVYDMAALFVNSFLTGYFWINGVNYCTNPTFMYVVGCLALGKCFEPCMYSVHLY